MQTYSIARLIGAALLAGVFAPALAESVPPGIPVWLDLYFDGTPLQATARVDISCFSYTENRWVDCRADKISNGSGYVLQLRPGKYRTHVSIDENTGNPVRFPGDYEAQREFEVAEAGVNKVAIDVPRLIHLVGPGDNGRALDGMLSGCDRQPRFPTPRYAWEPAADIDFAWQPVVAGAQYKYNVFVMRCQPWGEVRRIASATTADTRLTMRLPANEDGQFYLFRIEAWKNGRLVGDFYTHDSGAHSWNYRFRVLDATLPRWAYYAGAIAALLLLLVIARMLRSRKRLLGSVVVVAVLTGIAAGGFYLRQQGDERRAERAAAEAAAAREAQRRALRAQFEEAAPRPEWWDSVQTPVRIDGLGSLLSLWQTDRGGPDQERKEREFFKAVYQAILDRPDDEDVAAYGIQVAYYIATDYPHRLSLNEYAFARFLNYSSRTDNCANCMTGDVTHDIALHLGRLYLTEKRPADALAVSERLLATRQDISPYKLAETHTLIGNALWEKGERERAISALREAVTRFGDTVNGDTLKRTLANYERDIAR